MREIHLYAFWPSHDQDTPHIGYGVHRVQGLVALLTAAAIVTVGIGLAVGGSPAAPAVGLIGALAMLLTAGRFPARGFYRVTPDGQLLDLISRSAPPAISGRAAMGRRRFLRAS